MTMHPRGSAAIGAALRKFIPRFSFIASRLQKKGLKSSVEKVSAEGAALGGSQFFEVIRSMPAEKKLRLFLVSTIAGALPFMLLRYHVDQQMELLRQMKSSSKNN